MLTGKSSIWKNLNNYEVKNQWFPFFRTKSEMSSFQSRQGYQKFKYADKSWKLKKQNNHVKKKTALNLNIKMFNNF